MPETEERAEVGTLQDVLAALSDPVRLEMVRRMYAGGGPTPCAQLYDEVSKSTASHHFKILREAGVIDRSVVGGQTHQALRLGDVEAAYPGVLSSILGAVTAAPPSGDLGTVSGVRTAPNPPPPGGQLAAAVT